MSETFVDVRSQGLEVGTRLRLTEMGPTSAYLEHPLPMPVGAELRVAAGDEIDFGVVVVRVHEQVGGAERPPGMFVRVVELSSAAEAWWKERVSQDHDPVFPEPVAVPAADARPTVEMSSEDLRAVTEEGEGPPPEPEARPGSNGAGESVSPAALAEASAVSQPSRDVASTMKMSADQIKSITDTADQPAEAKKSKGKGKGKKRRRAKRSTSRR